MSMYYRTHGGGGGHSGRVVILWPPTSEAAIPSMAASGKAGSCLPLAPLFLLAFQLPIVTVQCKKRPKTPSK